MSNHPARRPWHKRPLRRRRKPMPVVNKGTSGAARRRRKAIERRAVWEPE